MITIIGILAALLLPALTTARESARSGHWLCVSNIHQIMLMLTAYAEDYNGIILAPLGNGTTTTFAWGSILHTNGYVTTAAL